MENKEKATIKFHKQMVLSGLWAFVKTVVFTLIAMFFVTVIDVLYVESPEFLKASAFFTAFLVSYTMQKEFSQKAQKYYEEYQQSIKNNR